MNAPYKGAVASLNRLLRMAAINGVESAIRIHIARGDDLNARDNNGLTPLMLAAWKNRAGACRLLLDAGADPTLVNFLGQDALTIANTVNANEAASVIQQVSVSSPAIDGAALHAPERIVSARDEEHSSTQTNQDDSCIELPGRSPEHEILSSSVETQGQEVHAAEVSPAQLPQNDSEPAADELVPRSHAPIPQDIDLKVLFIGGGLSAFDELAWEPDADLPAPPNAPTLEIAAVDLHEHIASHVPIDTSSDWSELDFDLPTSSAPFLSAEDVEARADLRLVLLRAIREGSVPMDSVRAVTETPQKDEDQEGAQLLRRVINDLGAEVDDRIEHLADRAIDQVYVDPNDSPEEEELVSAAIASMSAVTSDANSPIRLYLKDAQRIPLINAAEETALSKSMEAAVERAIDALARWPLGIQHLLKDAQGVHSRQRALSTIYAPPSEKDFEEYPINSGSQEPLETLDVAPNEQEEEWDLDAVTLPTTPSLETFLNSINQLATLPIGTAPNGNGWKVVRETITSISLSRRYPRAC